MNIESTSQYLFRPGSHSHVFSVNRQNNFLTKSHSFNYFISVQLNFLPVVSLITIGF